MFLLTADQLTHLGLAVLEEDTGMYTSLETEMAHSRTGLISAGTSQGREFYKFLSMSGP